MLNFRWLLKGNTHKTNEIALICNAWLCADHILPRGKLGSVIRNINSFYLPRIVTTLRHNFAWTKSSQTCWFSHHRHADVSKKADNNTDMLRFPKKIWKIVIHSRAIDMPRNLHILPSAKKSPSPTLDPKRPERFQRKNACNGYSVTRKHIKYGVRWSCIETLSRFNRAQQKFV